MNYQSFLDFHVLQVTLYKKNQKFNWISFFHDYNLKIIVEGQFKYHSRGTTQRSLLRDDLMIIVEGRLKDHSQRDDLNIIVEGRF